jgi:predicted nucleotidyltransferase component of viral defense system
MHGSLYPTTVAEVPEWSKTNRTTVAEGQRRFVQYAILLCVGAADTLRASLAFKGGNALRFVHGNPRSTLDLDFTALPPTDSGGVPDDKDEIRRLLDLALAWARARFSLKLKCQRVDRKPPVGKGTLPTYDIGIGYQFPGDRYYADFEIAARSVSTVVQVEVSFNDVVCQTELKQLESNAPPLTVCSLEDILAEKLRALLQQIPRDRTRPQDVFDVYRMLVTHGPSVDRHQIAEYLIRKSVDRQVYPSKAAFRDPQVRDRAQTEYPKLQVPQAELVPFDDAWAAVLRLVDELPLPESAEG